MHNDWRLQREGFTLVELLVVVGLFLVLVGGLLTLFLIGRTSYLSADASTLVQQESRQAFDNMVRELREAGPANQIGTTPLPNGTVQLNFQIVRGYNQAGCPQVCWGSEQALGEWVHYAIIDAPTNTRQLIRCTNTSQSGAITAFGANCRVMANNIRHPNQTGTNAFIYAPGVVTVNLEIQYQSPMLPNGGQTTGVLTSAVKLRNTS